MRELVSEYHIILYYDTDVHHSLTHLKNGIVFSSFAIVLLVEKDGRGASHVDADATAFMI